MKIQKIALALSTVLILNPALSIHAEEKNDARIITGESKYETILTASWGTEHGQLQMSHNESPGVEAFTIDNSENFYLLDSLSKKIVIYDNHGKWIKDLPISFCDYPTNIAVGDQIYIQDETGEVYALNHEGIIQNIISLPSMIDAVDISDLYIKNDQLYMKTAQGISYLLNHDSFHETTSIKEYPKQKISPLGENSSNIEFSYLTDEVTDLSYIKVAEKVPDTSMADWEFTIQAIDSYGNIQGVTRLPYEQCMSAATYNCEISKNGYIYWLSLTNEGAKIEKISLGTQYHSQLDKMKKEAKEKENLIQLQNSKALSLSRNSVLQRAQAMADYQWVLKSKNENYSSANAKRPTYLVGKTGVTCTGIPYCWGGFFGMDRSSVSACKNYADALSQGYTAGDINTTGYYKGSTAGLDCSGFVSAAYGYTSKKGTSNFATIGKKVTSPSSMDFYVSTSDGHIVLYAGVKTAGERYYTYEATTAGSEKAIKYSRSLEYLKTNNYELRSPF